MTVANIDDVDLADIDPCPGCGRPVRRFANVPVSGNGLDIVRSGPWYCPACIDARARTAAAHLHPDGPDA